jgi:hypothetical protein
VFFVEFAEMESQGSSVEIFDRFKWKIEKFSQLNVDKIYSESFMLGGYPWYLVIYMLFNLTPFISYHLHFCFML